MSVFREIFYTDHACRNGSFVRHYWLEGASRGQCRVCELPGNEQVSQWPTCLLSLPVRSAHSPVLFRHALVARIAFIPSQTCSNIAGYCRKFDLHCGVVDSQGQVHHYMEEKGVRVARHGWSDAVILNVADKQAVDAETWENAISKVSQEDGGHRWSPESYRIAESIDAKDSHDCLDFAARVAELALSSSSVSRFKISTWVSPLVDYLRWYAGTQHRLAGDGKQLQFETDQ